MSIEFDMDGFFKAMDFSKANVQAAAVLGMHDATDALLAESRDEAPLDKGTLRETSGKRVTANATGVRGEVYFSAVEKGTGGGRVNYALIVHEMSGYQNPTTPGTKPKYLEDPLTQNASLYQRLIADAIRKGLAK
ncbi:HK97 gp10 family phage protein [Paenibacillus sp. UASWS1643]|uniref:HK97 gp10 family phage protein n=1 Tax=Paenibacillus sp. UASWS1643 TaxID=2580422 RepID=UPI001239C064|nr:HK97 gp10 family phage protein [Paenibacillus sp. UASWS1643]KAA8750141.1 HK97 gp10 family phage protein [Paenibacillus sp. UASWS1643]